MKICVLASGSKGNSILISGIQTNILIDAGISGKKISEKLNYAKVDENSIKAIFITHEHSDHIKGAGVISRKLKIPIFANKSTFQVAKNRIGKVESVYFFENGNPFTFNEFLIEPFSVPHDCEENSCFKISERNSKKKLVILTDAGYSTRLIKEKIKNSSTIILESNHDFDKLINGPYDWSLKQRIKSNNGHLSNSQACELMSEIIHPNLENIILAHLSEENNEPEIAKSEMHKILNKCGHKCNLFIASQNEPTDWIEV
ncbi:MAG: MBL fold metallo-hydrolase [Candidatus Cloacimonetes bacterium]|nr:MBL fold metallo-hydrolase [Candidatus Cloacimonadota bacterium]